MEDPKCDFPIGTHTDTHYWDRNSDLTVCSRHKAQYDSRPDLGPFDWVLMEEEDG